jgi:hypothetical protein
MKPASISNENNIIINQAVNTMDYNAGSPVDFTEKNPVIEKLSQEGYESLYDYLNRLGLASDPDILILPSSHHYYFEAEDLKNVKTIVNLKQLNNIKQIKDFFHNIYHILPQKSLFIGSFTESKNISTATSAANKHQQHTKELVDYVENGITYKISFLNIIYNFIDFKTNRFMTKGTVNLLLENSGFKIIDMTEFNGLTFFCSQKVKLSA